MSDDYGQGHLSSGVGSLSAGDIATAYGAYKGYKRVQPFLEGAINAGQGAWLGADVVKVAGGQSLKTAAGSAIAKVAPGIAARAGIGVAAGAAEGAAAGSVVPGIGTVAGAVVGAVAPFIIPHIPIVGKAVNKIPLVGEILSPSQDKEEAPRGGRASNFQVPSPHLSTGPEYSASNRADYLAGRGFRRGA